jgi:hypothetical protein
LPPNTCWKSALSWEGVPLFLANRLCSCGREPRTAGVQAGLILRHTSRLLLVLQERPKVPLLSMECFIIRLPRSEKCARLLQGTAVYSSHLRPPTVR